MTQKSVTQAVSSYAQRDEHSHGKNLLGPILCWAVVFADIGTSVYYVPGILYGNVGSLAGFFVFLTMSVFVLLTLKYAEVSHRFPQGGGVVTVAAQAMNHWVGALGGMFILVDYFLTAAISSLSGMQYLSVVIPMLGPSIMVPVFGPVQVILLMITIGVLVLLGILNWVGISESAKLSLVGAVIAFVSDIAILITVFTHISFSEFLALFPRMFVNQPLTVPSMLYGFAGLSHCLLVTFVVRGDFSCRQRWRSVPARCWYLPVIRLSLVPTTYLWRSRVWNSSLRLSSDAISHAARRTTPLHWLLEFPFWC